MARANIVFIPASGTWFVILDIHRDW